MDAASDALATLRRTHAVLFAVALGILVASIPQGPDVEGAIDELALLQRALGPDGYVGHCASVARPVHERTLVAFVERARTAEPPLRLSPTLGIIGLAGCRLPDRNASLEVIGEWLAGRAVIDVASIGASWLEEIVASQERANVSDEFVLDSIYMGVQERVIFFSEGGQSYPMFILEGTPADSLQLSFRYRVPGRRSAVGIGIQEDHGFGQYWEYERRSDWLLDTPPFRDLAIATDDGVTVLPGLSAFWNETATLSLSEASRYLQARADQGVASVEVLGIRIGTSLIGWLGPFILVVVALYFLLHLRHLVTLGDDGRNAARDYPWIALFDGRLAWAMTVFSLVVLPASAALAFAVRLARPTPILAVWSAAGGLICLIAGVECLRILQNLRRDTGIRGR